jgi:hypothetical protein
MRLPCSLFPGDVLPTQSDEKWGRHQARLHYVFSAKYGKITDDYGILQAQKWLDPPVTGYRERPVGNGRRRGLTLQKYPLLFKINSRLEKFLNMLCESSPDG